MPRPKKKTKKDILIEMSTKDYKYLVDFLEDLKTNCSWSPLIYWGESLWQVVELIEFLKEKPFDVIIKCLKFEPHYLLIETTQHKWSRLYIKY